MKRSVVALFMLLGAGVAQAQECPRIGNEVASLDRGIERSVQRLMFGEELKIVALGSSSTAGAGASDDTRTYPSRLEAELRARFPFGRVTVINRGRNGDTAGTMLERLEETVLAEHPHLVIFQVGTNTILREQSVADAEDKIVEAMQRIKAHGAEVILMDSQFAPAVERKVMAPVMKDILAQLARRHGTSVFPRHALMERWHKQDGLPVSHFITPDELHMNDYGYRCMAKALAGAISEAANRQFAFIP